LAKIFTSIPFLAIILADRHRKEERIMIVDFALDAERKTNMPPKDAIYQAVSSVFVHS